MVTRDMLTPTVQHALGVFNKPDDECWATFGDSYIVSNYGLVVNLVKNYVVPWRTVSDDAGDYYIVSVDRSTLRVASLVHAAHVNNRRLLPRSMRLAHLDGDTSNVALTNLVAVPRTSNRVPDVLMTATCYQRVLDANKPLT